MAPKKTDERPDPQTCWHEYRWGGDNVAVCIKCGHTREIRNKEFLARIKRRDHKTTEVW